MITFIFGGARSGKSRIALSKASGMSGRRAYIATAQALDDEMKERIERHKKERPGDWMTFEEPINISSLVKDIHPEYDIILIDCLTLWLSNIMHTTSDMEKEIKNLIHTLRITHHSLRIYIVSNEVGQGIVPDNELSRRFREMAGELNQKIAEIADEVFLVTAGIPLKIKGD
ncbi:MAG: bifunctional adenosylcobinamide kinase/adenosylcobinamide-phosphate guanylyltransferase [Thermodesulfovibrio sp.]|nr:bifunctional adenosylcobinamide kinase/adenosylcobinamide-phosphate guanylyltransferase [Thermodesulfovibrio sp.]